jgi:hypothetical protein
MKTNFLVFAILMSTTFSANAQLKIRPEGGVQMSYNGYCSFYLGTPSPASSNGEWSFESWGGGFNLWKPWPNPGAANFIFFAANNGNVGIGTGTPAYKLDVNGDIATYGVLRVSSDSRLKSNIKGLTNCLNTITKLEGKSYNKIIHKQNANTVDIKDTVKYNTMLMEKGRVATTSSTQFGLLAQDVKTIYPELVQQDSSGFLNVDYLGLIPILIEALKEQKHTCDAQSLKIKEHEDKLAKIEAKNVGTSN